ncbi:MAG: DDE-type integrase/transposase/recombinase [Nostoc sp. S4]|nr:DDE-type integrase/transposase/recombinase [Nostoc sp. S4]
MATQHEYAPYPKAIDALKAKKELLVKVELRQNKSLNQRIEQDHRFIRWLVKPGIGFKSFNTARRTIKSYEIMHMVKKGQIETVNKGAVKERINLYLKFLEW